MNLREMIHSSGSNRAKKLHLKVKQYNLKQIKSKAEPKTLHLGIRRESNELRFLSSPQIDFPCHSLPEIKTKFRFFSPLYG